MPEIGPVTLHNGTVLPADLVRQLSWSGENAAGRWFATLPDMLRDFCERWEITLDPTPPALNYNLVLFGTTPRHGPVVVKTCPPNPEATAEIDALTSQPRPGVVRVIDSDPTASILMQERVVPGDSLEKRMRSGEINDADATGIAAWAMRAFSVPVPENSRLIPLRRWFRALHTYRDAHQAGDGPIPSDLVDRAVTHAQDLLSSSTEAVVLHGDMNPGNILWDANKGWTVIDPKGLLGPIGYEIGTWMINPYGIFREPDLAEILDRRLDQFQSLLGVPRRDLWQWAFVHALLSECWTLESRGVEPDHLHALVSAKALLTLPEAGR